MCQCNGGASDKICLNCFESNLEKIHDRPLTSGEINEIIGKLSEQQKAQIEM